MSMKILHLVGKEKGVIWKIYELEKHIEALSEDRFEQMIVTVDDVSRNQIEGIILRKAYSLGRRLGLDILSAYRLGNIVKAFGPDVLMCWSYDVIEQVKYSVSALRTQPVVYVVCSYPLHSREVISRLRVLVDTVKTVRFWCWSKSIVESVRRWIPEAEIYMLYQPVGLRSKVSKCSVRSRFGFLPDDLIIFLPGYLRSEEVIKGIISAGVVHQIFENIRVVITNEDKRVIERIERLRDNTLIEDILYVGNAEDSIFLLRVSDILFLPMLSLSDTSVVYSAASFELPIVGTSVLEPKELFVPNQTYIRLEKFDTRSISRCIYRLIKDTDYCRSVGCSLGKVFSEEADFPRYRARLINLYTSS